MNVLVVGAGPTGLTTATELARRGIKPTLIDQRDGPSPLSRAVGITPASLERLAECGAANELIAKGVAMKHVHFYRGAKRLLELPMKSDRTYFPHLVALPQDQTEGILRDALMRYDAEPRYGCGLVRLEGKTAIFSDGSEAAFDTVIGADGVRSAVRQSAGIGYPGFDLEGQWSIADVDLADWRHKGDFTVIQAAPGIVAVVAPLGQDRFRVISNTADALATLPFPVTVRHKHREGQFQISIRQAERYQEGHVFLAGDAAHCHSPVGGRGMNIGIADGAELARLLAAGTPAQYSPKRHAEGAATIATTERARKMLCATDPLRRGFVYAALKLAGAIPPLARLQGRNAVEL